MPDMHWEQSCPRVVGRQGHCPVVMLHSGPIEPAMLQLHMLEKATPKEEDNSPLSPCMKVLG